MPRIVSLLPSATEIVAALGFEDDLVGRSHECDFPLGVEALPICTSPRLDVSGLSGAIDRDVHDLLRRALAIYDLDVERLQALRPDVVVTQTQCDVCAVPLAQVELAARTCLAPEARIVALEPTSLEAVWADMRRVAAALGAPDRGEALVERLRGRLDGIATQEQALHKRPRVASIEWIEPLMAGGNWMPELIALAGGDNLLGTAGTHSPVIAWEALRAADPDVLLVLPCGFGLGRTRAEAEALRALPGWPALRAVRSGRVYLLDGNQYFNRPGPRLVESVEILAEVLHPGAFRFGHEGRGWEHMAG
ncbi:MAG TPA: cobalamin-binding protein [bacterium]|nr:cobalamin-binding protein [bacterium]